MPAGTAIGIVYTAAPVALTSKLLGVIPKSLPDAPRAVTELVVGNSVRVGGVGSSRWKEVFLMIL